MKIQITKSGTEILISLKELKKLKLKFKKQNCIFLKNFIEYSLADFFHNEIKSSKFHIKVHKKIGEEFKLSNERIKGLLHFLINDKKLFDFIKEITGCKKIGNFTGRVYRFTPEVGNFKTWHEDTVDNRIIAMSINLGKKKYSGGIFQIRNRKTKKITYEVANTGFGDVTIFKISNDLQHRVTPVKGKTPKTAFAGWFRTKPSYLSQKNKRLKTNIKNLKLIKLEDDLKINDSVLFQKKDKDNVLLNTQNGYYYKLNPISSRLWNLISKKKNLGAVFYTMKDEYEVNPEILKRDIIGQVQEFQAMDLVNNTK